MMRSQLCRQYLMPSLKTRRRSWMLARCSSNVLSISWRRSISGGSHVRTHLQRTSFGRSQRSPTALPSMRNSWNRSLENLSISACISPGLKRPIFVTGCPLAICMADCARVSFWLLVVHGITGKFALASSSLSACFSWSAAGLPLRRSEVAPPVNVGWDFKAFRGLADTGLRLRLRGLSLLLALPGLLPRGLLPALRGLPESLLRGLPLPLALSC
mmetsp:Transcript_117418/g.312303  ORF Transcript_117418/g.312303 Transcript_117418/m.312303 type:complete len:215 (+) Transcript_117418:567-1211(+)